MGYEVRMYVVRKFSSMDSQVGMLDNGVWAHVYSDEAEPDILYGYGVDGDTKLPSDPSTCKEMTYSQVVGMIDLCKPGDFSSILKLMQESNDTDCYIFNDDGDTLKIVDRYDEFLKEASVQDVIEALEKDCERDSYWRFPIALSFLKSLPDVDGLSVLFYGY